MASLALEVTMMVMINQANKGIPTEMSTTTPFKGVRLPLYVVQSN